MSFLLGCWRDFLLNGRHALGLVSGRVGRTQRSLLLLDFRSARFRRGDRIIRIHDGGRRSTARRCRRGHWHCCRWRHGRFFGRRCRRRRRFRHGRHGCRFCRGRRCDAQFFLCRRDRQAAEIVEIQFGIGTARLGMQQLLELFDFLQQFRIERSRYRCQIIGRPTFGFGGERQIEIFLRACWRSGAGGTRQTRRVGHQLKHPADQVAAPVVQVLLAFNRLVLVEKDRHR